MVGEQAVEAAEAGDGFRHQALQCRDVLGIAGHGERRGAELRSQLARAVAVDVADGDLGSFLDEAAAGGLADTRCAAGDDGDLALQSTLDGCPPVESCSR
jgi:hypothetical protein